MESHLQALIDYFSAYPRIALGAIFAASLLEALAVIGTVIPGSSIVFAGGILIGLNVLNPWWTAAVAVTGAILGDGISYWLGHHYHEKIRTIWPLKNYPGLFERGQAYFAKNGGKSVFLGRFIGPVRAIVPVVAGMSNMPPMQFYAVNILSALAWVAAHLVPGVLFGASLQLAGAMSSRLLILLVIIVVILWVVSKLVRFAYNQSWQRITLLRDRALTRARGKSGPLARIVLSLFDPARAESQALLTAAVLLIGSVWLFFGILEDVVSKDPLIQLDQTVYTLLQGLRNEWGDSLMVTVTGLGGASTTVPVIIVVSSLFAFKRYWRTLGYWLAAAGFAEMLVWVFKYTLGRARPNNIYAGVEQFSFPSGHATLSIVVYGFMAFLLARGKPVRTKIAITLVVTVAIMLIAFSRLYLGVHWFSDVLAGLSLGLAWVALLSIAYTHHVHNERIPALPLLLVVLTTLALAGGLYVRNHHSADVARYAYRPKTETMLFGDWKSKGWHSLPFARSELGGEIEEPFSVQWIGTPGEIVRTLAATGWRTTEPWASKAMLLWLLPNTTIQQLPVLPKFDHGEAQKMTFIKVINSRERIVFRLWPLRYVVDTVAGGTSRPLWNGMVTIERLQHPIGITTLTKTETDFNTPTHILEQDVKSQRMSTENRERRGIGVLLVW
ncbi:MAG: phosphatase PAP2 family protein [Glaciimonas sp.]|nr:phosphatase PAP2 family protein [Glaciimonas sp.]